MDRTPMQDVRFIGAYTGNHLPYSWVQLTDGTKYYSDCGGVASGEQA